MRKIGLILILISVFSISCKVHLSKYDKKCKKSNTFIFLFNKTVKYPIKLKIDGKEVPILNKKGKKLYIYNLKDGEHEIEFLSDRVAFINKGEILETGKPEELKEKYNWSMSYWSFCKYMKEEVIASEKEIPVKQKPVSLPVDESLNKMPVANMASKDPQAGDNDMPQEEANSKVDELVKLYDNAISDKWKG